MFMAALSYGLTLQECARMPYTRFKMLLDAGLEARGGNDDDGDSKGSSGVRDATQSDIRKLFS